MQTCTLLAVQRDARVRLDTTLVLREAARQLQISSSELRVMRLSDASFLLRFPTQHQSNTACRLSELRVGHIGLQLLPWTHQVGVLAELSKFKYRVRLCIEGVPGHARQDSMVASLFPPSSFIDEEICGIENQRKRNVLDFGFGPMSLM